MNGTFGKMVSRNADIFNRKFNQYTGHEPTLLKQLPNLTPVGEVIFRPFALSQIRHTAYWLLDKVEGISGMLKLGVIAVLHTVVKMKGAKLKCFGNL